MLPLPVSLLRRGESGQTLFALEVYGNSMQGAGIADGDIVVAHRQQTASDGDIVVALLGDEATVKTFYRERGRRPPSARKPGLRADHRPGRADHGQGGHGDQAVLTACLG